MKPAAYWLSALALSSSISLIGCRAMDDDRRASQQPAPAPTKEEAKPVAEGPKSASRDGWNTSWMAFPTGNKSTSVVLLEYATPAEVRLNTPFEYMLNVTNLTDLTLDQVLVAETLPAHLKVKSATPAAAEKDGAMRWEFPTIGPRETKQIRVNCSAESTQLITHCASVAWASKVCISNTVVEPKLKIEKNATPEVLTCEPITFSFRVTNSGTATLRGVRIEDPLAAGLTREDGGNTITINVGDLAPGQSRDFTAMAKATKTGTYENKASAKDDSGTTAMSGTTKTVVKQPKLEIAKSGPKTHFIGRPFSYDIEVKNVGDGVARNAMLEDVLPAGTRFLSATDAGSANGGRVSWNLGNMAPGASKKVSLSVVGDTAGKLRNVANASAFCAPPVQAEWVTELQGIPALLVECVDDPDPVLVGTTTTYTIEVLNQGSATATNIKLACDLEACMEYVSSTGDTTGTLAGSKVTFAQLPTLASKARATWRVVIKGKSASDARFKITVTYDQSNRPVEETEPTNYYQ